jgi:hypothetical protein
MKDFCKAIATIGIWGSLAAIGNAWKGSEFLIVLVIPFCLFVIMAAIATVSIWFAD